MFTIITQNNGNNDRSLLQGAAARERDGRTIGRSIDHGVSIVVGVVNCSLEISPGTMYERLDSTMGSLTLQKISQSLLASTQTKTRVSFRSRISPDSSSSLEHLDNSFGQEEKLTNFIANVRVIEAFFS